MLLGLIWAIRDGSSVMWKLKKVVLAWEHQVQCLLFDSLNFINRVPRKLKFSVFLNFSYSSVFSLFQGFSGLFSVILFFSKLLVVLSFSLRRRYVADIQKVFTDNYIDSWWLILDFDENKKRKQKENVFQICNQKRIQK